MKFKNQYENINLRVLTLLAEVLYWVSHLKTLNLPDSTYITLVIVSLIVK